MPNIHKYRHENTHLQNTWVHTHTHTRARARTHTHRKLHIYTYTCKHSYTYTLMQTHTPTHTFIHTNEIPTPKSTFVRIHTCTFMRQSVRKAKKFTVDRTYKYNKYSRSDGYLCDHGVNSRLLYFYSISPHTYHHPTLHPLHSLPRLIRSPPRQT